MLRATWVWSISTTIVNVHSRKFDFTAMRDASVEVAAEAVNGLGQINVGWNTIYEFVDRRGLDYVSALG